MSAIRGQIGQSYSLFQQLESRTLYAASAVKTVDSPGPIEDMVEAGGKIYVSSRHASGSSVDQIYVTHGGKNTTRKLLDINVNGAPIASLDDLVSTDDGRVFFTATAVGGRHVFELNTSNGTYKQLSTGSNVYYKNLTAAGKALFVYEANNTVILRQGPGGKSFSTVTTQTMFSTFRAAGSTVFYVGSDQGLYRSNGNPAGTLKISENLTTGIGDFFTTNDYVYFEGRTSNNTSLYRTSVTGTSPIKIADDFSLVNTDHAELGEYVYFSGGYYNTSGKGQGSELYRAKTSDGAVEIASDTNTTSGSGVAGTSAIGNSIYFVNNDGDFITSQGTGDRELFRFDTVKKTTTLVTKNNQLYPIEVGGAVLGNYYFVAAPTKDDARWGSRALYRTDPATDKVEVVSGVPTVADTNGKSYQEVQILATGARGLFFSADTADAGRDTDVFFVSTPFSNVDAKTQILTIQATEAADVLTMKVVGAELVITLNGIEERHALSSFGRIEAYLKEGNDTFTSNVNVTTNTYVFGDLGDDIITTGAGQDTITGGAGKNQLFGGEGADRLNGSGGRDSLDGQAGEDRIYGNSGSDNLVGGAGIDRLFGGDGDDILSGGSSNDKLYGEVGDDFLYGGNQSDLMLGGAGDDYLDGAIGDDTLDGESGVDQIFGGEGDDEIFAIDGEKDLISGDLGNDTALTDASEGKLSAVEVLP
jgi:Ca2+-binding RTX toxin-like protein